MYCSVNTSFFTQIRFWKWFWWRRGTTRRFERALAGKNKANFQSVSGNCWSVVLGTIGVCSQKTSGKFLKINCKIPYQSNLGRAFNQKLEWFIQFNLFFITFSNKIKRGFLDKRYCITRSWFKRYELSIRNRMALQPETSFPSAYLNLLELQTLSLWRFRSRYRFTKRTTGIRKK